MTIQLQLILSRPTCNFVLDSNLIIEAVENNRKIHTKLNYKDSQCILFDHPLQILEAKPTKLFTYEKTYLLCSCD